MAAPNLASSSTAVVLRSDAVALSSTSETVAITNGATSNKALRIKAMTVHNTSTTLTADITRRFYKAASGGTAAATQGPLTVPAGGSLILIGAENPLAMEEDRRVSLQASAANQLSVEWSWEEYG